MKTSSNEARRRLVTAAVAAITGFAILASVVVVESDGGQDAAQGSSAPADIATMEPEFSGDIVLAAEEAAEWDAIVASPELRDQMVTDVQEAFSGIATVSTVEERELIQDSSIGEMQLVLAYGVSGGTHFWITASYADMARGLIWGAMRACISRGVPSWICHAAGNQLHRWAQGWGSAANHGVWAAIYWAPPRWTGGRW